MMDQLLAILAPHTCYACGQIGLELCASCSSDITSEPFAGCVMCRRPTARPSQLCSACKDGSNLEEVWCVAERQGALHRLVDAYKFSATKSAATPLAKLLNDSLPRVEVDYLTIIPTARPHVRQLGYDHAEEIARRLAKQRNYKFRHLLSRRDSLMQHHSGRVERIRHAKQLFMSRKSLNGRDILLIDDVLTTGASLQAAATVLKKAGAKRIYGAIIARQPID